MSKPALPESQAAQAKDKYRVTNWPDYDRALVRRGDDFWGEGCLASGNCQALKQSVR